MTSQTCTWVSSELDTVREVSHHCLANQPQPGCGTEQLKEVRPGSVWLICGDGSKLAKNVVAP